MPRMDAQIKEIAEGVYDICPEPTAEIACSCYLVEAEWPALVETGPSCQTDVVVEALAAMGREPSSVFVTHNHFDHCGGLGRMLEAFPRAMVFAHERTVRHLVDPSRLVAGIKRVFGDDFEEVYGPVLPIPPDRIRPVRDGDVVSLGDRELRVVHTPGHVGHHIAVHDPSTGCAFVGDAIGASFYGAECLSNAAPPDFDLELELATIEKLRRLGPTYLCPAHSGPTNEVERCLDLAEAANRQSGEIVLRAARAGETPQQIGERLRVHFGFTGPSWPWLDVLMVPGYLHYFRKTGLIEAAEPRADPARAGLLPPPRSVPDMRASTEGI